MTGVILVVVGAGILAIRRWDDPLPLNSRSYVYILAASLLEGNIIILLTEGEPGYSRLLLAVMGGSLLLAAVTDRLLCQVHNFIWWPALAAASVMLLCGCSPHCLREAGGEFLRWSLLGLAVFVTGQFCLFGRTYGKADCYAFCICGIAEAARGIGLTGMLLHMIFAYGILFPVQMLHRNVDRRGRFIRPVPFLPYIVIAFWGVLLAQNAG